MLDNVRAWYLCNLETFKWGGNKMNCQLFSTFSVFLGRELKVWNFQKQLIFAVPAICILLITRNILHAALIVIMPSSTIDFHKIILVLLWVFEPSSSPTKDRCDTNFMLSLSLFLYRWLLQNETSLCYLFPGPGASFLLEIFYDKPWSWWRAAAAMWIFPSLN